jgi:rhodanese-related sulfurtransferase
MFRLSKQSYVVGAALIFALIMAFFPTTSFIKSPFTVNAELKQQNINETGIFTVSPIEAAKYFSYDQSKCFWIDLRHPIDYKKSHLKIALNQTFKQLQSSSWNPDDLILVYGYSTDDAQEAVAYLRQVKNARAFAIKGGFDATKKYLIDPIDISITNELSDQDLQILIDLRNRISGEKVSSDQLLDKLKSSKSKSIREGC